MKLRILALMTILGIGAGTALISCSGKNPASPSGLTPMPVPTSSYKNGGVVTTLAGTQGSSGFVNGNAGVSVAGSGIPAATFYDPYGVAADNKGNVYVADEENSAIRKISSNGTVSTLASGFDYPEDVAVDNAGNVYVADTDDNQIKEITTSNVLMTLAGNGSSGHLDGAAASAEFDYPFGVAVDNAGNVYVSDEYNYDVRKISNGVVSTIAGNGTSGYLDGLGGAAEFSDPYGIAVDNAGNVYVADQGANAVRKITPGCVVSTFADIYEPTSVAVGANGTIYVSNWSEVWQYSSTGTELLAGNSSYGHANGTGSAASFYYIYGIAVSPNGVVYVADENNQLIRQIQ